MEKLYVIQAEFHWIAGTMSYLNIVLTAETSEKVR